MWEANAKIVEEVYAGYVNWKERFYLCPECEEPVFECDWSVQELVNSLCPVCGFTGDEKVEMEEEE